MLLDVAQTGRYEAHTYVFNDCIDLFMRRNNQFYELVTWFDLFGNEYHMNVNAPRSDLTGETPVRNRHSTIKRDIHEGGLHHYFTFVKYLQYH